MAKDIDIIIKARNDASAELKRLSGELANLSKSMGNAGTGADKAGNAAKQSQGAFSQLGAAFSGANAKAVLATVGIAGVGVTVANTARATVSAGINFESALAGVAKTTDLTVAELDTMSAGIRNMATEIPIAATQLAGLAESAGALGVAKEDILEFTRVTALIGTTTDVTADQAATSLGQLGNVLGLTSADYEKFGSALVALGNDGASTESAILALTERAGAGADLIGFATEETLAWGSAVANLGIEADAGGTALQTFFIASARAVADAGIELDTFAETAGMTASAFQAAFSEDSSAALQTFISGLGELDQASQLAVLSTLGFNDSRITRTLLGLASNTDNLTASLATAEQGWADNSAMAVEATKRFETTESQIQLAKNALNDAAITISTAFLPAIADAAQGVANFATGFTDAVDHFTSESSLNSLNRWTEAMKELGTEEIPIPEPPEDAGRRWGHLFSDMAGHDWGSVWESMRAPDDIMNEFDVPVLEITDAQVASLQKIVDAYGDIKPEMGGVTLAQKEQAELLLLQVTRTRELRDMNYGQRRDMEEGAQEIATWLANSFLLTSENQKMLNELQDGIIKFGPDRGAADMLSMDLLAAQSAYADTSTLVRDEQQAMGEGFTKFSQQSEMAASDSTASFDRFASAFQGNTELAMSSLDDITQAAQSGALDFDDAMGLYAGIPRDVLVPAVTEAAAELRGKLADATLSEEDARAIEGQVEALRQIFPDLIAEIDGVAGAFGNFGAIQDVFQSNIAAAGEGVSEWQGHLSGAETALGFLDEQLEKNGSLTAEQQAQYDALTEATARYAGGVEDESVALIDAEVAKAEFIKRQDELNQALADGKITHEEYQSAIAEAASGMDPLTEATLGTVDAMSTVLDKIRELMEDLGVIPEDVPVHVSTPGLDGSMQLVEDFGGEMEELPEEITSEMFFDKRGADMSLNEWVDTYSSMPDPPPTVVTADTATAHMNINEFVDATTNVQSPPPVVVTADTWSAAGAIQSLLATIRAGATMPVSVVVSGGGGGLTQFADGGDVDGTQLAWVGERGKELVHLPDGAHVYPHSESMAMAAMLEQDGVIPGYADGGTVSGTYASTASDGTPVRRAKGPQIGAVTIPVFFDVPEPPDMTAAGLSMGDQIMSGLMTVLGPDAVNALMPSAEAIADAMIQGAILPIESEVEGVADTWIVNLERIPELAAGIGQDTAMALMEQYATLQGELQLAILSGEDQSEIRAQLDAILALFEEWGISVIGTATTVSEAMEAVAEAAAFEDLFSVPSGGAPFSLGEMFSGEALANLKEAKQEFAELAAIAYEKGFTELGDKYMQMVVDLSEQEIQVNAVLDSQAGQVLAEDYRQQLESAALGEIMNDYTIDEIFSGDAIAQIDEVTRSLERKQAIALELGDEALAAEYAALIAEMEAQEVHVNVILDSEAGAAAAEEAAWAQRAENFGAGPEFGTNIQADIDALDEQIRLGELADAPAHILAQWESDKAALVAQSEQYWYDIARGAANGLYDDETLKAYAEAGGAQFKAMLGKFLSPEGAEAMIDGVTQISDEAMAVMTEEFANGTVGEDMIQSVVDGFLSGFIPMEDAMALLAEIPEKELYPVIAEMGYESWEAFQKAMLEGSDPSKFEDNMQLIIDLLIAAGMTAEEAADAVKGFGEAVERIPSDSGYGWTSGDQKNGGKANLPSGGGSSLSGSRGGSGGGSSSGERPNNIKKTGKSQSLTLGPNMGGDDDVQALMEKYPDLDWDAVFANKPGGLSPYGSSTEDWVAAGLRNANVSVGEYSALRAAAVLLANGLDISNITTLMGQLEWAANAVANNADLLQDSLFMASLGIIGITKDALRAYAGAVKQSKQKRTTVSNPTYSFDSGSDREIVGVGISDRNVPRAQAMIDSGVFAFGNGAIVDHPLFAMLGDDGTEMAQPLRAGHPERQRFIDDVAAASSGGMSSEQFSRLITAIERSINAPFVVEGQAVTTISRAVGSRVTHMLGTKAGS